MFSRQFDGSDLSADFFAFPIVVVSSVQIRFLIRVVPVAVDFDVVRNPLETTPELLCISTPEGCGLGSFRAQHAKHSQV
jgi:hypothetical protein